MRSRFVMLSVVFLGVLAVCGASATEVSFSLSGTDPAVWSSAGTLSLTPDGSGHWLVTNASGNFNGTAITGVWPTTNNGNVFSFNNVLYSPEPTSVAS